MNNKCYICGFEGYTCKVECANGYIHDVCQSCYKMKVGAVDTLTVLQAKVEGIIESLSDVQKSQAEGIARMIIERKAFEDVK